MDCCSFALNERDKTYSGGSTRCFAGMDGVDSYMLQIFALSLVYFQTTNISVVLIAYKGFNSLRMIL